MIGYHLLFHLSFDGGEGVEKSSFDSSQLLVADTPTKFSLNKFSLHPPTALLGNPVQK